MDFDLTEEQRLLRDSVVRLLSDHYGSDKRRSYLAQPEGWSRGLWAQYAELGLLGLPFPEDYGGFSLWNRIWRRSCWAAPQCGSPAARSRKRRCCRKLPKAN